ncbi:type VI secretion system lipoprotein TssJ [Rouxiella sp. Mn2063]|uniref:type VI secretion system lipoprotein TssJ n=1 Tax=Rouxiella sp. Mn2063 TaxID=3395262 RepID=UPI003BB9D2A3
MATIAGKNRFALLMLVIIPMLSGCGLTQTVSDGTVAVTKSIFYKQVKTLHLDIKAREAINNNASGAPLATVVRIYQLKERKVFDGTDYPSLFAEDSQAIKADLLEEKDIRIRPGAAVTIDVPLDKKAQYVAVVGLFLAPDITNNTWRVVLSREDLDPDKARQVELNNHGLTLLALKDK